MILKMFGYWLRREYWERDDFKDFYRSESSFYKSIIYLREGGLINAKEKGGNQFFTLSDKGVILARILCSLPDVPDKIKKLQRIAEYDDLDMNLFKNEGFPDGDS